MWQMFQHEHGEEMNTRALIAMMLSTLYSRRFFPFWLRPMVAGLDRDGKGVAAAYDPVGTPEYYAYGADGSAGSLILPFLISQVRFARPFFGDKMAFFLSLLKTGW